MSVAPDQDSARCPPPGRRRCPRRGCRRRGRRPRAGAGDRQGLLEDRCAPACARPPRPRSRRRRGSGESSSRSSTAWSETSQLLTTTTRRVRAFAALRAGRTSPKGWNRSEASSAAVRSSGVTALSFDRRRQRLAQRCRAPSSQCRQAVDVSALVEVCPVIRDLGGQREPRLLLRDRDLKALRELRPERRGGGFELEQRAERVEQNDRFLHGSARVSHD